eukprot:3162096-Rhodomonas_salina.1
MAKQQSERVKAVEAELEAAKKATDEATKAADDAKKAVEEAKMEVEALQEQVEGKGDDLVGSASCLRGERMVPGTELAYGAGCAAMAEEMVKAQKEQLEQEQLDEVCSYVYRPMRIIIPLRYRRSRRISIQARAELERVRGDREEESTGKAAGAKKELEAAQTEAATLRAKVQQLVLQTPHAGAVNTANSDAGNRILEQVCPVLVEAVALRYPVLPFHGLVQLSLYRATQCPVLREGCYDPATRCPVLREGVAGGRGAGGRGAGAEEWGFGRAPGRKGTVVLRYDAPY